jgi:hypothetical protein
MKKGFVRFNLSLTKKMKGKAQKVADKADLNLTQFIRRAIARELLELDVSSIQHALHVEEASK